MEELRSRPVGDGRAVELPPRFWLSLTLSLLGAALPALVVGTAKYCRKPRSTPELGGILIIGLVGMALTVLWAWFVPDPKTSARLGSGSGRQIARAVGVHLVRGLLATLVAVWVVGCAYLFLVMLLALAGQGMGPG